MFNATKTQPAPASLSARKQYDAADVIAQLRHDFYDKCYLCGDKINKDLRVEHFAPHLDGKYPDRKFDWNNLFLSCDHCNSIKSNSYNHNGKSIINPVTQKPEALIGHKVTGFSLPEISFEALKTSGEITNTIELLEKIFHGHDDSSDAQISKCEHLRKSLEREFGDFIISIHYYKTKNGFEKELYKAKILDHLSDKSAFIEFKRHYVTSEAKLKNYIRDEFGITL